MIAGVTIIALNTNSNWRLKVIYCYLRVSTDMQDVESQKIGIVEFCKNKGFEEDQIEWFMDEGVSGAKDPSKRNLGKLLKKAGAGDIIVASEISRIGRKLVMILDFIKECTDRDIKIYTVKDRYVLEDTIQSKVLVTVMGLAAEIERDLLRQRTKEGLRRAVLAGKKLGRPFGCKNVRNVLTGREDKVHALLSDGLSKSKIAKKLRVSRQTIANFAKDKMAVGSEQ